jgi:hypothetical protein
MLGFEGVNPGNRLVSRSKRTKPKGPEYGATTDDVVKGMIAGHTISAYTNCQLQFQITAGTFAAGNPGFGFNEGRSVTYGITGFEGSDTVSAAPARP